ncbi:class I SAM-dependent methyltransferase, partial [Dolichospermum sp. ST_sed4]|nr:class I SAM-dependent methyltransferase [Dolichospermum sp. ST_sed4]
MKLRRHEHYYTKIPKLKKKKYEITAAVEGVTLKFVAASGVFSPKKLDPGTLALIRFMQFKKGDKILDLGWGYGAIGVSVAKFCPSCTVVLTDINDKAVGCSKINIKINNVPNASAKQSHFFAALKTEMFDIIFLNPPQTAGLDT